MSVKQYWPQPKCYFFAEAIYFPERLIDSVISYDELNSLFPDNRDAYITVEPINEKMCKIVAIKSKRFADEFNEYLRDFYYDHLTTLQKNKPERAASIMQRLFKAVLKKKDREGTRPVIDLVDIWHDQADRITDNLPFWDFLFGEAKYGLNIEIINIGYDGEFLTSSGASKPLPYAEISLRFGTIMYDAVTRVPALKKAEQFNTKLELRDYGIAIVRGSEEVPLKRLKPGMQYYNFVEYLLKKQSQPLQLADIQEEVDGAKRATDLTELARQSGFDPTDKKLFFEYISSDRIKLRPKLNISKDEFEALKNRK